MATGRKLWSLALASCVLIGSGCTLYQPRPVTFNVRDGDTGQPVSGAHVRAHYVAFLDFGLVFATIGPQEGLTDGDGNLTLIVDPSKYSFNLRVTADGFPEDSYIGKRIFDGAPRWGKLIPGPWYRPSYDYQIRLYRGPRPTADVTVPDGYRGVVLVRFVTSDHPSDLAGQRTFSYSASPRGVVRINDGGVFEAIGSFSDVQVHYPGGPALPTCVSNSHRSPPGAPADDAIALRFITVDWKQHTWLYMLGTAAEAEAVERTVWPDKNHFDQAAFDRILQSHEAPGNAPRP
jgi:hypothetical protein